MLYPFIIYGQFDNISNILDLSLDMLYYSENDIQQKNPFELEPKTLEISWFLRFYAWWSNRSIKNLSGIVDEAARLDSTESLVKLLAKAQSEASVFNNLIAFLPNWLIFKPINDWVNNVLMEQVIQLKNALNSAIDEAVARHFIVYTNPKKLAPTQELDDCLRQHQQEIDTQPHERPCQTYAQITRKIKDAEESIVGFQKHREFVVKDHLRINQAFYSLDGQLIQLHSNLKPDEIHEAHLKRIDGDIRRSHNEKNALIEQKNSQFFLPAVYDQPEKYKEFLSRRTKNAIPIEIENNVLSI